MKNKANYFFILIVINLLLLGSCSPASIPTPTLSPTATATFTPTNTPTITPSPTETPDPNKPADATGQDKNGYYKVVQENGKTTRYYWVEIKNKNNDNSIKGWFASHILDGSLHSGIPLNAKTESGGEPIIPLYADFQEGVSGFYLHHTERTDDLYSATFPKIFFGEVRDRYFGENFNKISRDEKITFWFDLHDGKISIPFSTSTGDYEWKPGPNIGYKFYAINWDEADPQLHPEFIESKGRLGREDIIFRWTVFTDANGFLVGVSAVNEPENLSDEGFLGWVIYPMATVLVNNQFTSGWSLTYGLVKYGFASGSVDIKIEGTPAVGNASQYFEIIHDP